MNTGTASRLTWSICGFSLLLAALSFLLLALNWSDPSTHVFGYWVENAMVAIIFSPVGAVVASRRPNHPVGWLFCTIGFIGGLRLFGAWYVTYTLLMQHGALPGGWVAAWLSSLVWVPHLGLLLFLGLLFPDGRLPSPRWRLFAWLVAVVVVAGTIAMAVSPGSIRGFEPIQNPLGIQGMFSVREPLTALMYALGIVVGASVFMRLLWARGAQRQQIKWYAYAAVMLAISSTIANVVSEAISNQWLRWVSFVPTTIALAGLPVAVAIAVLRYRLYDIDIVINRTLVYGALTVSVVSLYVVVVMGVGTLVQTRGNFVPSLIAVGLVAVVFQPLRHRLQQAVNRLMYGQRDEPRAVLSRLGKALEGSLASTEVLPAVCETLARALKLPFVAVDLKSGEKVQRVASHGKPTEEVDTLPLIYQKEVVGELLFSPRRGEQLSARDLVLLEDVCRHAAVAAHDVGLAADLQRSREQLVSAREEERRRIRRDLHDGLGPSLATLTLHLDAARNLMRQDPDTADVLLHDLKGQVQDAIADIRQLVYALRPPTLDELGLLGAIREQAARYSCTSTTEIGARDAGLLSCEVEAPEKMTPLPAAVEVAAYRIVQEALTNAARHSGAKRCRARISLESEYLLVEVTDDGTGLPEHYRAGVGMSSMRERAEELGGMLTLESMYGGGTKVCAALPVPQEDMPVEEDREHDGPKDRYLQDRTEHIEQESGHAS